MADFVTRLHNFVSAGGPEPHSVASDMMRDGLRAAPVLTCLAHLFVVVQIVLVLRRRDRVHHAGLFWLLATFVLAGGLAHGLQYLLSSRPADPFWAVAALGTALTLVFAAAVLIRRVPKMVTLRDPAELRQEFAQRRRIEMELRQVHAQLESVIELRTAQLGKKTEEMEQFLNTVSHDLKNPIVTCLGLAGMLREDVNAGRIDETLDSVERIERSVKRMQQFIEDLLCLSRVGKVPLEIERVDVGEVVKSIRDDVRFRLEEAGATLEIEGDLPLVLADARRLTEVFENLITNAMKYGCDNPQPRITVGCVANAAENRIFVRDNGRGIDPAYHTQIFEPFRRLRSDKEGSGMGLAIVVRIVKLLGGRAWIDSKPGEGSTFWIGLPPIDKRASCGIMKEASLA